MKDVDQTEAGRRRVELRRVQPTDEPFLYEVYCGTRRDEIAAWGWPEPQQDMFLKMQFRGLQQNYGSQPDITDDRIILSEGQTPVGRIIVLRTDKEICLADISLLPENRGHGIGTKLIRELFDESDSTNRPVTLHVEKNNSGARRLYDRLGFKAIADAGIHYKMERRSQPQLQGDENV
ncbi:MAG TPA: GNAT family N-acetyltransferase [Blastocatellia bacterium]